MPKKISKKPLDLETFIRAAMQTGKAPPAPKPPKSVKKRKAKKS